MATDTVKTTTKNVRNKRDISYIYVGPNIKNLSKYSVFKNELPKEIEEKIAAHPILKNAFIDVLAFNDYTKQLQQEGSKEQQIYMRIEDALGGK